MRPQILLAQRLGSAHKHNLKPAIVHKSEITGGHWKIPPIKPPKLPLNLKNNSRPPETPPETPLLWLIKPLFGALIIKNQFGRV